MKRLNRFRAAVVSGTLLIVPALLVPNAMFANTSKPPQPLEERVRHELVTQPYYNVFDDISFRVEDGTVTLFGQVTQPVVKDDAARAVKHLEGVKAVRNEIEVLPLSGFDDRIRRTTFYAIYGYGPLQRYGAPVNPSIHILVRNGNVTLSGVVANEADRTLAYVRANGVPGVFSVTNDLRVERH